METSKINSCLDVVDAIEHRLKKQKRMDTLYMDLACRCAEESVAVRTKVGAVVVKDDNVISMGWNGMPAGLDNECEDEVWVADEGLGGDNGDYQLVTKPEVLHAETNALMKLAANTSNGSKDATLYVTLSPCADCAKLIKQAKIKRVVFKSLYRKADGIKLLKRMGIVVEQI